MWTESTNSQRRIISMAKAKIKPPPKRKGKGTPPPEDEASNNLTISDKEPTAQINFTVPKSFKDRVRAYAFYNEMKMVDVLRKAFDLLEEKSF